MVLIVAPTLSLASTVTVRRDKPSHGPWAGIDYRAARGEVNRIEVFTVDERTIRVRDTGAVIRALRGCRSVNAHVARCSTARLPGGLGLIGAKVDAGDMDDVVRSHGPGLTANGGLGSDLLESDSGVAGTLNGGGGGRDTLLGGRNSYTLIDGDSPGAVDSDVLDGRQGYATVSYRRRTASVRVDLGDPGPDGEPGEADVVRAVASVIGGSGPDQLRGDERNNRLTGGRGADRLYGEAGDDWLQGDRGRDHLYGSGGADNVEGSAGDDRLIAGDGDDFLGGGPGADTLLAGAGDDHLTSGDASCEAGTDTVTPARRDFVERDCELVSFSLPPSEGEFKTVEMPPYPELLDADSATFRVHCPYEELDGEPFGVRLSGTLRLVEATGARRELGTGRIPTGAARGCADREIDSAVVRVDLNPIGRELTSARGGVRVTVSFTGRNVPPVPWAIRLAGPSPGP